MVRIKETADIVGGAPETVLRVLRHLKQRLLLAHRRRCKGARDIGPAAGRPVRRRLDIPRRSLVAPST